MINRTFRRISGNQENNTKDRTGDVILSKLSELVFDEDGSSFQKIPSNQNMQFDNNGLQPNIEENGVSSQPINEGVQIALEEVMQEQQENC